MHPGRCRCAQRHDAGRVRRSAGCNLRRRAGRIFDGCTVRSRYVESNVCHAGPADGAISIAVGDLTTSPTYINYDTNGTTVQLIAGLASDGSARVALNTCQVCNPSPKAYFAQDGSKLVCQNCGNKFTMDDVGDAASGCNPTQVEFMESDGVLSVPTSVLDAEAKAFAKWQGPTA